MMTVTYNFPLYDQQCGALMGNGETGAMLWGSGNILNITVGCGSLWDHRGGMEWTDKQNFKDIRAALEAEDLDKIRTFFNQPPVDGVRRPSIIPVGRVTVTLPENAELLRYEQDLSTGITRIIYESSGEEKVLEFAGDFTMNDVLSGKGLDDSISLKVTDAFTLTEVDKHPYLLAEHSTLREHGFVPPESFAEENLQAFIQSMPADPEYSLICRRFDDGTFTLSFKRGIKSFEEIKALKINSYETVAASSENYFAGYWKDVPRVKYHVPQLQQVYYHSLFKYGIVTNPAGVVPGLQAAWIEDNRLPPWQGDYHFNINIQMCMLPGLKSGKFAHLKKMFDMVLSWKEILKENARNFAGLENGYMLPHAVDDRGTCMGGFWTGTIDQACSAWMAQMMFDYCEYSGDMKFLADEVYDFMQGVLRVYRAMMERDENGKLALPVTVSPEFRGSDLNAWGKNASFQLAACHQLAKNILRAGKMLGREADAMAAEIRADLPLFTEADGKIALWENLPLDESHRHHSHLAGIAPFEVIDPLAPEMAEIMGKTLFNWTWRGMGEWTGWCLPWASEIWSRCGNGGMAELILKIWQDCFNNAGGGSLHDGRYKGFTVFSEIRGEVMQIDGGMGAITAIQEQFLHVFDGELRVFYGIAPQVRDVSFENIAAPGELKVSGSIGKRGEIKVAVSAVKDTALRLSIRKSAPCTAEIKAGETLTFTVDKSGNTIPG